MIEELADLLDDFPGEANRTRCFMHILNLVAKSIIKQFDVPKARANEVLDDVAKELAALAVDLDIEEQISREDLLGDGEDDADEEDNVDGWTDVRDELFVKKHGGDAKAEGQRAYIHGGYWVKKRQQERKNGGGEEAANVSTHTNSGWRAPSWLHNMKCQHC
jgi:hypothetical protein